MSRAGPRSALVTPPAFRVPSNIGCGCRLGASFRTRIHAHLNRRGPGLTRGCTGVGGWGVCGRRARPARSARKNSKAPHIAMSPSPDSPRARPGPPPPKPHAPVRLPPGRGGGAQAVPGGPRPHSQRRRRRRRRRRVRRRWPGARRRRECGSSQDHVVVGLGRVRRARRGCCLASWRGVCVWRRRSAVAVGGEARGCLATLFVAASSAPPFDARPPSLPTPPSPLSPFLVFAFTTRPRPRPRTGGPTRPAPPRMPCPGRP